jgi:hypothetical protein
MFGCRHLSPHSEQPAWLWRPKGDPYSERVSRPLRPDRAFEEAQAWGGSAGSKRAVEYAREQTDRRRRARPRQSGSRPRLRSPAPAAFWITTSAHARGEATTAKPYRPAQRFSSRFGATHWPETHRPFHPSGTATATPPISAPSTRHAARRSRGRVGTGRRCLRRTLPAHWRNPRPGTLITRSRTAAKRSAQAKLR